MERNPGAMYVGKEVFYHCREAIKPLIDNSALLPLLNQYDLCTPEDTDELISPFKMQDRFTSLVSLIERQGENGFMMLYMCLRQSTKKAQSHAEAVQILNMMGELVYSLRR